METILIGNSRWKYFFLLFISLAFVASGVFLLRMKTSALQISIAWMDIIFFGACAAMFIWQLVDSRPRIRIDHQGIYDRTLAVGVIPWEEITDAYVKSIRGNDFICLVVRNPEMWTSRFSNVQKTMMKANLALGFSELNVNLSGTKANAQQIHELILKLSAASRA